MYSLKRIFSYNNAALLLGFFSTAPIISIPMGSKDIAVFRVLFYGILLYLILNLLKNKAVKLGRTGKRYLVWLIEAIIACFIGYLSLMYSYPLFSNTAHSYIGKIGAFLLFLIVWESQKQESLKEANAKLIKGILWGCIVNLIWAVIDGGGYYLTGKSINNIVFSGYILRHSIRYGMLSLISRGYIRAAGFNSDPAQIGFIAPLVLTYGLYKKKIFYIVLAVLGVIVSASTTALVVSLAMVLHRLIKLAPKRRALKLFRVKSLLLLLVTFFLFAVFMAIYGDKVGDIIIRASKSFFTRIDTVYLDSVGTNIRMKYLVYLPKAIVNLGGNSVFGLGFGTASFSYITDNSLLAIIGESRYSAYDMENTYIAYLLDTGIVGFVLFARFSVSIISKYRKACSEMDDTSLVIFCGLAATYLSMLFYHYILFSPQVLICIVASSEIDFVNRSVFVKNYSNGLEVNGGLIDNNNA